MESNVLASSHIIVEIHRMLLMARSAGVDNGVDGHKGAGIKRVVHDTHLQMIGGGSLADRKVQLQVGHRLVEGRQRHVAAVIHPEAVAAAVGIAGTVVDLRTLSSCHRHILGPDGPTWGHHAGGGGGAGGLLVEVHRVGNRGRSTGRLEGNGGSIAGVAHAADGAHRNRVIRTRGEHHQVDIGVGEDHLRIAHDAGGDGAQPRCFVASGQNGERCRGGGNAVQPDATGG